MSNAPKRIELIARAVIIQDGMILTCRDPRLQYCILPGGHIEPGEPAEAALLRELEEEGGLGDCRVGRCLRIDEQIFVQRTKPRHEINILFHVELPQRLGAGHPPIAATEPHLTFDWVDPAAPAQIPLLPPNTAHWLARGVDLDKTCWRSSP